MTTLSKALSVAICLSASTSAQAGEVSVAHPDGQRVIRVVAFAGERNQLEISSSQSMVVIRDHGPPVSAGPGCEQIDASTVQCPGDLVVAQLRDGDDVLTAARCRQDCPQIIARGGTGRDLIAGGLRADEIYGGPGPDNLDATDGGDLLEGGPGSDAIRAAGVSDPTRVRCGAGRDIVFPSSTVTVGRTCERFGETGWGYSTMSVDGDVLRLGIKTLGCRISLRIRKDGPVVTAEPRVRRTPVQLHIPDRGTRPFGLWGRRLCDRGSIFLPLFRVAAR